MKKLLLVFILFPCIAYGQCNPPYYGNIRVVVDGDRVVLFEDSAIRNCGAVYQMKVGFLEDTLVWLQYDIGPPLACFCTFNLSVTLDSVKSGSFIAKFYHTGYYAWPPPYSDTCYVGSLPFEVESNPNQRFHQTIQNQSECYTVTLPDKLIPKGDLIKIYPNPAFSSLNIETDFSGLKRLVITDLRSKKMWEITTYHQQLNVDVNDFKPGIYLITLEAQNRVIKRKFCKISLKE